jgi:hypothetical protein
LSEIDVAEWASNFWRRAGGPEPFPRSLESAVAWALPLAVVKLPRLGLRELREWLAKRGIPFGINATDRRLRACVLARAGRGAIFLDGTDLEDELRLSLAHEVSHFVCDYLDPRRRAMAVLGPAAREVLDGLRAATPAERLTGLFGDIELGGYTRLMERSPDGDVARLDILDAEDRADRLALELLAPRATVLARLEARGVQWREPSAVDIAGDLLRREFGLPDSAATQYGRMLVMSQRPARSFREWLGA